MRRFLIRSGEETLEAKVLEMKPQSIRIEFAGEEHHFDVARDASGFYSLLQNSHVSRLHVDLKGSQACVTQNGESIHFEILDEKMARRRMASGAGHSAESGTLTTPMPGRIVKVAATAGDAVKKGQALVVVEAMKMENEFKAPHEGTVKEVKVKVGDSVEAGAVLVVME